MKRLTVIAFVLCSIASCTHKEDTESGEVWLRPADLKPAARPWQPSAVPPECNEVVGSGAQAAQMLRSQPSCTDAAVAALERFSLIDPSAKADLVAAYALRAQRNDRPSDLLNALDVAQKAPRSARTLLNRALIEEALGLNDEAIHSWNEFLKFKSMRTAEGRGHRDRLVHRIDPTAEWARNQARLPAALRAHDRQAILRLITPYPSSAEKFLEEELLRKESIDEAKTLAVELSRLTNDRFVLDVVGTLERSPDALQAAHLAFAEARRADRAFSVNRGGLYEKASQLLDRGRSPLNLLAHLGFAVGVSFDKKPNAYARASALLEPIELAAHEHGYERLVARVRSTRANFFLRQGRYVESLAESEAAVDEYKRDSDIEGLSDTRMRRIGVFRTAGHNDLSWREAMQALQTSSHLPETRARHALLGELAATAAALDHAAIALLYQNTAVHLIQQSLAATPPEQIAAIDGLLAQLSPVLRSRATIEIQLHHVDRAVADLEEASRLKRTSMDPEIRRILQARIEEARGQSLLRINPSSAARAFSQALALATKESRTNRALLLAQRAEAQRRAGKLAEAKDDLRASLDQLHAEEMNLLQHRKKGSGEEIWSSYFSRFPQTYQHLILQLLDEGRTAEAFDVAEKARAFEPLYLVSEIAPKDFDGKTKTLAEIRQALPAGTLLIEYSVLPDQTIVWLVSREGTSVIHLRAGKADIERRGAALQRAAGTRNQTDFETQSFALYEELMDRPLATLGAKPERLVIVPDGPLHGLPFAALRNPQTHRYLIEDFAIEIAGSANLYLVSLRRNRALSAELPSILIVGDPAFNPALSLAQGLRPLAHARSECEKIYPLYGPHARMLLEREATIPRFLDGAEKSSIIHVAAHSVVNAQVPTRSFILLAPAANEPGPLDVQALLTRLSLKKTRLVVLSTCSSAGGLPVGAEGVAPFVRPLIGAGVPAVVGTLWNVEDATAEELLVSFHRHYRDGHDAAIALQLAQVGQLRNKNNKPGLRSVLAWAPYQVIGHGSSPFAPAPQHKEKPP